VGTRDVSLAEETDLICESVRALRARFDTPISVDTWRAAVAAASYREGAVIGNDLSGFCDRDYLAETARAGATAVATHMRLAPQVPDPEPRYHDVVEDVAAALTALVAAARAAGLATEQIVIDPGLDLGKTWRQSVRLLAGVSRLCELGHPVLVAPSYKIFLGRLLGLEKCQRGDATTAACTAAMLQGARIVRVHDAAPARQAADLVAALVA
jgi:dihydropteroate synthase